MCGSADYPGKWRNYDINFENIYQSLVSLFVLSTLEGWPDYMY
ncbi:MAG: ion transporter [bacterium]